MVSQAERERSGAGADAQCPPSAAGSRQGAMQAVGYAAEATEAGRAAEHSVRGQGSGAQREGAAEGSAERATPSSATPMVLHVVGE